MVKVWVTRDEPADGPLCSALAARGLEPVCEPVLTRRVNPEVAAALATLGPNDWLVLASPYAVAAIPPDVRCRIAVVGEGSRAAALERGLRVERTSPDGTGEGLWRSLQADSAGARRVWYPRSSLAQAPEPWPGIELHSPILYDTAPRQPDPARLRDVDIAAVASPSAARGACAALRAIRFASIGPTTSAALRQLGVEPWLEAPASTFESLADAIARRAADQGAGSGSSRHQRA